MLLTPDSASLTELSYEVGPAPGRGRRGLCAAPLRPGRCASDPSGPSGIDL